MTGLQTRLLDRLAKTGPELAVMLAIDLGERLQHVYAALVALEAMQQVRVIVPRNKRPKWMLGPGFVNPGDKR